MSCFAVTVPRLERRVAIKKPQVCVIARNIARRPDLSRCSSTEPRLAFAPMPSAMRTLVGVALFSLAAAAPVAVLASPYISLDDSRLPLLEHLIARGDAADPPPMFRPVGRAGDGEPYLGFWVWMAFGPVVGVGRASVEPSLVGNADRPNRAQENVTGQLIDGYVSAQFNYGALTCSQQLHNWEPIDLTGISLSDVAFERQRLVPTLGTKSLRLRALASDLTRQTDRTGQSVNRHGVLRQCRWVRVAGARADAPLRVDHGQDEQGEWAILDSNQ